MHTLQNSIYFIVCVIWYILMILYTPKHLHSLRGEKQARDLKIFDHLFCAWFCKKKQNLFWQKSKVLFTPLKQEKISRKERKF